MKVRIGTRGSDLALWQARHVAARLEAEGCTVEIRVLETRGDRIDHIPLHEIEGKAFFTAEIENALLERSVDVAVHSHKDLPVEGPPGLAIVAVPERADARERLLVAEGAFDPTAAFLPVRRGASIGTSAPRRAEQLQALRPDLEVRSLRGNVPTRVRRLREGRYDAIVLAAAGLDRLQLDTRDLRVLTLPAGLLVPSPSQGALAIQTRADDHELIEVCRRALHQEEVARSIAAERRLLVATGGGCNLPLGCHVERHEDGWRAHAFLGLDHPAPGAPARWVEADGETAESAVDAAFTRLTEGTATGQGPLAGKRFAIVGSSLGGTGLGRRLETLGASVIHERVLEFEPLAALPSTPEERLAELGAGDGLAVTSREAARRLGGSRIPMGVIVGAVGRSTAAELVRVGIRVDVVGTGGARELASCMPIDSGKRVLFPCAEDARPDLEESFDLCGVVVERLPLYRTLPLADASHRSDVNARIYMSPSAFDACLAFEKEQGHDGPARVALGATTARAIEQHGFESFALEVIA